MNALTGRIVRNARRLGGLTLYPDDRAARHLNRMSPEARRRYLDRVALLASLDAHGAYDPHQNFAYSTVQAGSTIIGSNLSPRTIVLDTGDGADFPGGDGSTQFNVMGWPDGARPRSFNAEVARVTRSGDTCTTTSRGAEYPSVARSDWAQGWQVSNAITVKWFTDIEAGLKPLAVGGSAGGVESRTLQAANDAILVPFLLTGPGTLSAVALDIATSSGNLDVGIYDRSGTRKRANGGSASPGTGLRVIALSSSILLDPGAYYLALSANNTTLAYKGDGSTSFQQACRKVATSYPLPSTITIGSTVPNHVPSLTAEVA